MDRVPLADHDSTEAVDDVHLTQLAVGEETSIQHFRIEPGAVVPEHGHHHEQSGYIFSGELTFVLADGESSETSRVNGEAVNGDEVTVGPDESYVLLSEEVHGAENRGDETVLGIDIFSPPRANPDWQR